MSKQHVEREVGGHDGLGYSRFKRYRDAFMRAEHCIESGYYLEAIAILDSLITDRLASRVAHLTQKPVTERSTCGQLAGQLLQGVERDPEFQNVVSAIKTWVDRRNAAMHATAKIMRRRDAEVAFATLLAGHAEDARAGVDLLIAFDNLDTASRLLVGKRPATQPGAFRRKAATPVDGA